MRGWVGELSLGQYSRALNIALMKKGHIRDAAEQLEQKMLTALLPDEESGRMQPDVRAFNEAKKALFKLLSDSVRERMSAANNRVELLLPDHCDLTGKNLRNLDLSCLVLRCRNGRSISLARANLQGADLLKADLQCADLYKAKLYGARLDYASLKNAHLAEADLYRASLLNTDLTQGDLREANLQGAELRNAKLSEADLSGALLCRANLTGVGLHGAKLQDADLREANLDFASLAGADLTGADLRYSRFCRIASTKGSVFDTDGETPVLSRAQLRGFGFAFTRAGEVIGYSPREAVFPSVFVTGMQDKVPIRAYGEPRRYEATLFSRCVESPNHPGLYFFPHRKDALAFIGSNDKGAVVKVKAPMGTVLWSHPVFRVPAFNVLPEAEKA